MSFTLGVAGEKCSTCGLVLKRDYRQPPLCGVCKTAPPASTTTTQLTDSLWLHQCRNCDWTLEADSPEPVEHVCGRAAAPKLGDRVESALTAVGVTKERWVAFKEKFGMLPTCNCESRQRALNQLGDELGDKAKAAVAALFGG